MIGVGRSSPVTQQNHHQCCLIAIDTLASEFNSETFDLKKGLLLPATKWPL
jgi:hypothetical protein